MKHTTKHFYRRTFLVYVPLALVGVALLALSCGVINSGFLLGVGAIVSALLMLVFDGESIQGEVETEEAQS